MFRPQMKLQKILAYVLLVTTVLFFIYSLGLMTDVYRVLYNAYDPDKEGSKYDSPIPTVTVDGESREVTGGILFYEMQDFNSTLLICAIILILVSLTNFVTGGSKRRNYYIGNFISVGMISVTNIVISIIAVVGVSRYRAEFVQIDFEALKVYNEKKGFYYSDSTLWFDLCYVMAGLLLIVTVLLIFNMIWKIKLMKNEKRLLSGEEVAA